MGKFNVADKVCLVTGSGRGLGKEFAVRLLTQRAKVCLSDVNEDLGQQAAAELAQKFGEDRVSFCKYVHQEHYRIKVFVSTIKEKLIAT